MSRGRSAKSRLGRVLLLAALATVALSASPAGPFGALATAAGVSVSPQPGTHYASSHTQISFVGASPADLADIRVSGSRTGRHPGRLLTYSTGTGTSFVPGRPFSQGETVSVRVRLPSGPLAFRFGIARVAHLKAPGRVASPDRSLSRTQSFQTRPDLHPPQISVRRYGAGLGAGDLFVAPIGGPPAPRHKARREIGQPGAMILDRQGQLVWFHRAPAGQVTFNFRTQTLNGAPVLTWWQGNLTFLGYGYGEDVILDSSYHLIGRVRAGNGYHADIHEFVLTPQGTALITVYTPIIEDLSAIHGSRRGVALDSLVQEVDVSTGLVMFEWHSADHIPLRETYARALPKTPIDPAHLNSVFVAPDGNLLLCARNTWAVYDISRRTGRIAWRLGGRRTSFRMGAGTRFAWQHDAQLRPDGLLTLFDDSAAPPVAKRSRGLILRLDPGRHTARLVRSYTRGRTLAGSQGNMQNLPNGNTLVGWGAEPYFSEFSAGGRLLLDGIFPRPDESYRAFSSDWHAQPVHGPSAVVRRARRGIYVYATWNGATEVAAWQVLGGASPRTLAPTAPASPRRGFETRISLSRPPRYLVVIALDRAGKPLGASAVLRA